MPNTDIEELRELLEANAETCETEYGEYLAIDIESSMPIISEFCNQKVIEARIDEVKIQMDVYSFLPTDAGGLANRNVRLKQLQAQLNHNKKGDSDEL